MYGQKKKIYFLNRITLRFADCTDKISRIYPVASSLIGAMLFADFCSIHVLLPTAPTNSNKCKSSCRLTSYMIRYTKPKFLVLLRELKPAMKGFSQLRHGVVQCPCSIKCLRHKVSSHPFPLPYSVSPFSCWLFHFWIIGETFVGNRHRCCGKLDFWVDYEIRWGYNQLQHRVPYPYPVFLNSGSEGPGNLFTNIHCKKGEQFSRPYPVFLNSASEGPGNLFTNIHCKKRWAIFPLIKLFPARESLVSDIPAGDAKIGNLFLQCSNCHPFLILLQLIRYLYRSPHFQWSILSTGTSTWT